MNQTLRALDAATPTSFDDGSFRDPDSRVLAGPRIFRVLTEQGRADFSALSQAGFFKSALADGSVVGTRALSNAEVSGVLQGSPRFVAALEHEPVPFISYPFEWSFSMLKDAALLHLRLLENALADGFTLKDGTAYNVQWRGAQPVFIDVGSFAPYRDGEPWHGYRQFCQLFLYPLMLQAYKGVPFQSWLRGNVGGLVPDHMAKLMGLRDLFRPGVFTHVWLMSRLKERAVHTRTQLKSELRTAGFGREMIRHNVRQLTKLVERLKLPPSPSHWTDYSQTNSYAEGDRKAKAAHVQSVAERKRRTRVWDLGCNTGEFTELFAPHSELVVGMDSDPFVIDALHARLRERGIRNVLPLVSNLDDGFAGLGWRGQERRSLVARGAPDLVVALALIHHLVFTCSIPLAEVIRWMAGLADELLIEFVDRDDVMSRQLLRNATRPHDDYSLENFERLLRQEYRNVERLPLASPTRALYFASR